MSDNVPVTPGAGATIATDDVAGVQYQRVKIDLGGDGSTSPLVRGQQVKDSSLPVALATDDPAVVSLAVLDDWDEADRAKVNPIVGQPGVAAGAGAVGATTQRVTLASNDPAVAILAGVAGLSLNAATSTGAGAAIGSGTSVLAQYAMRVTQAGCSSLVVALQVLLDGWATVGSWSLADGRVSGDLLVAAAPGLQVRANITTIAGGGNATAYIAAK
jgi:hypothetical protein